MTKLVIRGAVYSVEDAFARPTLNDLVAIKRATGLGAETIAQRVNKLSGMPAAEVLDDADLLDGFRAFVWLARRAAGEKLTLEEASDFSWDEWSIELEGDDVEDEEVDPGQPAALPAPVVGEHSAESQPTRGRSATTRTSRKQS
jgi:hypothetical protein